MTLREFVEQIAIDVGEFFAEHGKFGPTYFIVAPKGGNEVVCMPAPPLPKPIAMEVMRELFKSLDTKRYCYVDEAWLVVTEAPKGVDTYEDARKLFAGMPMPREHPDRTECIMLYAEDHVEGFYTGRRMITRDADGKGTLGPLECEQPTITGGQMTALLPVKGTRQ